MPRQRLFSSSGWRLRRFSAFTGGVLVSWVLREGSDRIPFPAPQFACHPTAFLRHCLAPSCKSNSPKANPGKGTTDKPAGTMRHA